MVRRRSMIEKMPWPGSLWRPPACHNLSKPFEMSRAITYDSPWKDSDCEWQRWEVQQWIFFIMIGLQLMITKSNYIGLIVRGYGFRCTRKNTFVTRILNKASQNWSEFMSAFSSPEDLFVIQDLWFFWS